MTSRHDETAMTPQLAIAAALIYCVLARSRSRSGDLTGLMHRLAEDIPGIGESPTDAYALIGRALAYVERTPIAVFAREAAEVLDETQRLCVLLNMADHSVADGRLDPRERDFLREVQAAFALPDTRVRPYFEAIALKNIRSAFGAHGVARIAA